MILCLLEPPGPTTTSTWFVNIVSRLRSQTVFVTGEEQFNLELLCGTKFPFARG